jgi:hypothetical protein
LERVNYPVVRSSLAHTAYALGDHETARRVHEEVRPFIPGLAVDGRWLPTMSFFAETACDLEDVEGARLCYRALEPCASYCNAGGAGAVVCRRAVAKVLGRLAAPLGRAEDAERHYAAGATFNRRIGAVPYLGETLLHWAELRSRTDPARARTLAEEAGAIAGRLGMSVVARASEALLERLRQSSLAANPPTRREREVADLVAKGRSNREIAEHFAPTHRKVARRNDVVARMCGRADRRILDLVPKLV